MEGRQVAAKALELGKDAGASVMVGGTCKQTSSVLAYVGIIVESPMPESDRLGPCMRALSCTRL